MANSNTDDISTIFNLTETSTGPCYMLRGDINHDRMVNPLDAPYFVNYLWQGGPDPPCMEEADVNGSGGVDPLDAVYLVNYFWNAVPSPVPCP